MNASFQKSSSLFKTFLLLAAGIFIYSFSMGGDFKTDDRFSILLNPMIRDWSHILDFFKQGYFGDQSYYRPLVYLTYTLEHHLFGGLSFFYNLDNVLIHVFNAWLVWQLVNLILAAKNGFKDQTLEYSQNFGFWVAFVFLIHPIHWEAVANISGRAVLLSTMFSLMSLMAFIRAFEKESAAWLAASIAGFMLALLSKESAGVLPGVFFLYVVLTHWAKIPWKKLALYLLPLAAIVIWYLVLRKSLGLDVVYAWPTLQSHILGVISFLRSVLTHLRLMVWPVGLYFDRSQLLFPSFDHLEVLYVSALWLLVAVELWILQRYIKPIGWFCLLWMAVELFPVSQIVAAVGTAPGYISAADHFMYAASIPVCIVMVRWAYRLRSEKRLQSYVSWTSMKFVFAAFLIFFAAMNIQQNLYARDEVTMLDRSLAYQPQNARLQNLAGYLAAQERDYRRAEFHFKQAVESDPMNPSVRISLGKVLCDQKRFGECLVQYLLVEDPASFNQLLEENIKYPFDVLQRKITSGESLSQTEWFGWGLYQTRIGQMEEAITAMENLLKMNPENITGLMTMASLYEVHGQITQARDCYLRVMNIASVQTFALNQAIEKLADLRMHHPEFFDPGNEPLEEGM